MIRAWMAFSMLAVAAVIGCRETGTPDHAAPAHGESWSVTAWGERYEVFAETDALAAGKTATCNAHITILEGFAPFKEGTLTVILRGAGGDQAATRSTPARDGIYPVEITPATSGAFELLFRVEGPAGSEEIPAGSVHVAAAGTRGDAATDTHMSGPEAIPFLKEQQWRTEFATAPVSESTINESVAGPGRVTAAAGGEVTLTAAVDGTVASKPWPFPGLDVAKGSVVLRILPRIGGRSLPDLEAETTSLEAEAEAARHRLARLTELLGVEATSAAEVERARATLAGLEARLGAARRGVDAATAPAGSPSDASLSVLAPWSGRVAEVAVSPGQTVSAGTSLARIVRLRPLWIVLALRPEDAARVRGRPAGLLLRRSGSSEVLAAGADRLRIVSRSPEVDRVTGTLNLIVEVDRDAAELPIGSAVEAELLLPGEKRGIVVPATALVDDGGVAVVYVQIGGEGFLRREVRVLARQGAEVLVEGLRPGERLVTRGGGAIRRSALLSSGAPEGHVH